ncbi:hypothetical protein [Pseudochryseolinea flava]|uniref:Uncharacterized protein n=1 Tax=Pseudochryseolinea flava TaxID=2059302 RepID=A0A364Y1N0_9BACT|nr:hypothetical protein [Pseudochryseolinea flava]RAV99663.1 hypothetical protein DQQ10_18895 [Pseudochryseolinea flava]
MAMTDKEIHALRNYCASILKEHGIQFDANDPVLPAVYIIHKEMERVYQSNQLIAERIDKAVLNLNPKVFHFNHAGEAWRFQLAIALKWILCGGLLIALVTASIWYWSLCSEVDRARTIVASRDNLNQIAANVKKNAGGSYFIDLTEAQADSVKHFYEYVRINKRTVRIFLGRK